MIELYQCSRCQTPFTAQDEQLIAMRHGHCPECTKGDVLEQFGLPRDFLLRRLGPGA